MTIVDPVLVAVSRTAADVPVDRAAARLLLADHLACVAAGDGPPAGLDLAGRLALRSHRGDRDDIYWPARIHPGSLVWPAVLATAAPGGPLAEAATAGYEAAVAVASWLGAGHAARFHATATSGHAGAAAAAAVCLAGGRDPDAIAAAVGLAMTTAGGVRQTIWERGSAGAWHRAAAASAGVGAAYAAAWGVAPPRAVLTGPAGVAALLAGDPSAAPPGPVGALAATAIRPYPVNGFAQSTVDALRALRRAVGPAVDAVELAVSPLVARACAGPDPWWDLAGIARRAWAAGDPFQLGAPEPHLTVTVREEEERPVESVRAWPSGRLAEAVTVAAAPGGPGPARAELAHRKWSAMGVDASLLWTVAGTGDVESAIRAVGAG
ncbi:MmgE/PrpD family protein [Phytohabitans kaempferiae]|uniref:MmgE/PrpD family protein n=1 Tax=Phytohabitans kaempferiae TaxID=1620943 RepID=A0ABV6M3P3_9ACTN